MPRGAALVRIIKGLPGMLLPLGKVRVIPAARRRQIVPYVKSSRLQNVGPRPTSLKPASPRRENGGRPVRMTVAAAAERAEIGARVHAAAMRSKRPGKASIAAAAVDRRTGKTYVGHNREWPEMPPELAARAPKESALRYPVNNCAEVSVAARALNDGAKLDDLVFRAVNWRNNKPKRPCANCDEWVGP